MDTPQSGPRPTAIDTPHGPVIVAGSDDHAAQAAYTDRAHAVEAMCKALAGIDAVAKRYGLHVVCAVGARHTDERQTAISAHLHGDGQFVGVALANMLSLSGWAEAFKVAASERDSARACRVCGCTEITACEDPAGIPCHWVEPDLCSACAARAEGEAN